MARKKADTETQETTEKPAANMTKADAVRAAVADGADNPTEGVAYIKAKFGIDMPPQHFSSYKAMDKKRGGKPPARRGRRPRTAPSVAAVSPMSNGSAGLAIQMKALKTLCDKLGVDQVISIAQLFRK